MVECLLYRLKENRKNGKNSQQSQYIIVHWRGSLKWHLNIAIFS